MILWSPETLVPGDRSKDLRNLDQSKGWSYSRSKETSSFLDHLTMQHRTKIRTSNVSEHLKSEISRRTCVVGMFSDGKS